ncbi:MAG: DNA polymerase III subunit gamma/tau [Flavobacteriales bacterium]
MSENFIVSARKYRPDTWDSVVGQRHITATLLSAIANNQVAQAYLFTGPRGIGKTTCARLFAKAVNDMLGHDMDELQFNIFELDAASNNSVEDIRTIVDTVRIPPQVGKYKVYIIDEVHMLSANAFNAFLKTLEEPPAHAIFILATTEKHKILPTILSRCQIFDFNRIKVKDIAEHLAMIAGKENVAAEAEALHVIAQKADGAMRDALSIFDQVVAFCGRNLTYDLVIQNLNVLDYDYYFRLTDLILKEDLPACLTLLNEVLDKGFDMHHFVAGMGAHMRNLLVSKDAQTLVLMEVSESVAEKYKMQAVAADLKLLIAALDIINQCDVQYRTSKHQRLLVELTLMKLASIPYNQKEGEKKNFRLKSFRSEGWANAVSVAKQKANPPIPPTRPEAEQVLQTSINTPAATASTVAPKLWGNKTIIGNAAESISIKKNLNGRLAANQDAATAVAEVEVEKPTRTYSIEEIKKAWKEFVQQKLQHNYLVRGAFDSAELELLPDANLRVAFPSEPQVFYFNDHRSQLGEFLRNAHDIRGLQFKIEILKPEEIKQVFKTEKQRYEEMALKNPALETLRKRFGLQVDF